jgi:proliferating cell nuclear antigen
MTEEPVKREGTVTLECSVRTLKESLAPLVALNDEALLTFQADSVSTVVVDPAHIALVRMKLSNHIQICGNADSFAVEVEPVMRVLKELEPLAAKVRLRLTAALGKDSLYIETEDGGFRWSQRCLSHELISVAKMPYLTDRLKDLGLFKTKRILDGIKLMAPVSDHFKLINDSNFRFGVWLTCEDLGSSEEGFLSWRISHEKDAMRSVVVRSSFPMEYFENFLRSIPIEGHVRLSGDLDFPLVMDFWFADQLGEGTFYLAPRIESGD